MMMMVSWTSVDRQSFYEDRAMKAATSKAGPLRLLSGLEPRRGRRHTNGRLSLEKPFTTQRKLRKSSTMKKNIFRDLVK